MLFANSEYVKEYNIGPRSIRQRIDREDYERYKKTRHFPIIIEQDSNGVFIIECPVLNGCRSYGESLEAVLGNIREAIQVCLDEDGGPSSETVFLGVRDIEIAL